MLYDPEKLYNRHRQKKNIFALYFIDSANSIRKAVGWLVVLIITGNQYGYYVYLINHQDKAVT